LAERANKKEQPTQFRNSTNSQTSLKNETQAESENKKNSTLGKDKGETKNQQNACKHKHFAHPKISPKPQNQPTVTEGGEAVESENKREQARTQKCS
jgi:hypothetical protein